MPKLLIVDDDPQVGLQFEALFRETGFAVHFVQSAGDCMLSLGEFSPDVVVLDIWLPDDSGLETFRRIHAQDTKLPVIFITAEADSATAIEAMKLGAYDYLVKPLDFSEVLPLCERAAEIRRINTPVRIDQDEADLADGQRIDDELLVGKCPAMQKVYKQIGRVASQNVTVLIRGENGTGKELIARAIYQHSDRAGKPFLAVNCAAIPESLLEAELFGTEKGAYTGADRQRVGKFEQCHEGTLFLDEIGDMTPLTQSKVLRVLQDQKFQRVGGNEVIQTDVRVIAATNRPLEEMIDAKEFRSDLYYRLNGFVIHLPPLRERGEDIVTLTEHFLLRGNRELGKQVAAVAPETWDLLNRYPWPGNVRELQSVVKQALLQATGGVLMPEFLPESLRSAPNGHHAPGAESNGHTFGEENTPLAAWERFIDERIRAGSTDLYEEALELMERTLMTRVLNHCGGNQTQASKLLGITRGSLRHKIRALNIKISSVVDATEEEEEARDS